jgi:hypothetical protein
MKPPIRLSPIDREHIQELYDEHQTARDELPYTEAFDRIWNGFQDRTFKNADREQVFAAMIKYVRSSTCPSASEPFVGLNDEQIHTLKTLLPRHARGGKILPYSNEFNAARAEFSRLTEAEVSERDFWRGILRATGATRRVTRRSPEKAAAVS